MHDTHTKAERWGTLKSTILSMIVGGCLTAIFQSRHMRPFMDSEAMPIMAFAIAVICLVVILKD